MNQKLTCFFILFFLSLVYASNDDYFRKSIFRSLKNRKGQFVAIVDQVEPIRKGENITILDYYNFDTGHGKIIIHVVTRNQKIRSPVKTIYMTKTKEFYRIFLRIKNQCYNDFIDKFTIKAELLKWSPAIVYNSNFEYSNLGPSVLMEVLLEQYSKNPKNIECENKGSKKKRCTIRFGKKIMIKYYLEEDDAHTMIPRFITVLEKGSKNKWYYLDRFVFREFKTAFNQQPKMDQNLDIGYGCGRLNSKSYPQIQTPLYNNKMKLDYQVKFNYIEVKHDNRLIYVEDKFNFHNLTTRSYSNSIYIDLKKSINIVNTVNEQTNASTTVLINLKKLNMVYNFDVDSDKCVAYDLPNYRLINWFYLQDQIIFNPQLFVAHKNFYSYIGEFQVENVTSLVFEKKFRIDHSRKIKEEKIYPKNSILTNKNQVHPDAVLATHYYPKDRNYWPNNKENFSVPFKIEFHLYDDAIPWLEIANLTVYIKSFNPNFPVEPKFDVTRCEKFGSSGQKSTTIKPTVENGSSNATNAPNASNTSNATNASNATVQTTITPSTTLSPTSVTDSSNNGCTKSNSKKLNDEDKKGNSSIVIRD